MFSETYMIELINVACKNDPAFCPNCCGHSYTGIDRKYKLKRHMVFACGVKPQFECPLCLKQFRYKQSLKVHVKSVHYQTAP